MTIVSFHFEEEYTNQKITLCIREGENKQIITTTIRMAMMMMMIKMKVPSKNKQN